MVRDIIAEIYPWESRVGIVDDGRLVEVFWADQNENVGNIYKGKVKDVLPGLSCVFVDIGLSKNAFLYAGDIVFPEGKKAAGLSDVLKSGQDIMVQVKKEAFSEKGARVTGNLSIPGHFLVLLPFQSEVSVSRKITDDPYREYLKKLVEVTKPDNMGIILRTACMEADHEEILSEMKTLLAVWEEIKNRYHKNKASSLIYEDIDVIERVLRDYFDGEVRRVIVNNLKLKDKISSYLNNHNSSYSFEVKYIEGDLFEKYALEKDIRRAMKRKVWLKSGGYLIFDVTEAMTVIDVNSGKYTGNDNFEDTIYKLNREAALEIPRQLRLRSVGGIILIDFIDMKDKNHEKDVIAALKSELEKDKAHTRIIGMTGLGFLEMTRKKSRYGIAEFFTDDCNTCHGRGHTINLHALSCEVKRKLVNMGYIENDIIICEGNPGLIKCLREEKILEYIQAQNHKQIKLVANTDLGLAEYNISTE